MSNPLRTLEDYEYFIYTLSEMYASIRRSTVVAIRIGASLLRVIGELFFDKEVRLVIRERIIFDRLPGIIDWYGYEVWQRDEQLFWYDSQPHPNEPGLQLNHPHHKHISPDIKHNRQLAPNMSFVAPNLPNIIHEVELLVK